MFGRKLVGLALAVLFVVAFTVQPAHAGLGGCFTIGCHPLSSGTAVGKKTGGASSFIIDSLRWFLPTNVVAYLQGTISGSDGIGSGNGHAKVQGLGGCFFGCKL
jgi:hypothetical protein